MTDWDTPDPVEYLALTEAQKTRKRAEYVTYQKGLCHHCKAPLSGKPAGRAGSDPIRESLFPRGFFQHHIHLHHDHESGFTIGAVHARCNAWLWQYKGE